MMKRNQTTAADLLSQLESDPRWKARNDARESERRHAEALIAEDERGLVAELCDKGAPVRSVYDYVNNNGAPLAAVPVLVSHLEKPHHPPVREGIIRSLSVSHARDAALKPLTDAYARSNEASERWLIANALASIATLDELSGLSGIREYSTLFIPAPKHDR
jgi:hypothetical protein